MIRNKIKPIDLTNFFEFTAIESSVTVLAVISYLEKPNFKTLTIFTVHTFLEAPDH